MTVHGLTALTRKHLDRDVVQTIASQTTLLGAALVVSIVTARSLGPDGRGTFFFITTIAALVAQFGNFGMVTTNTYIVAKEHRLLGQLTSNCIALSLTVALVAAGLVTLLGPLLSPRQALLYFAAAIGGARLFQLLGVNLLAGVQRFRSFNLFQIVGGGLLVSAVLLGSIRGTVTSFLSAMVSAALLTGLLLGLFIHRLSPLPATFNTDLYSSHFSFSARSYAIHTLGFLMLRGSVFLIEKLSTMTQLGYYSVGTQIVEAIGVIPGSMALVLYPRLVSRESGRFRYTLRFLVTASVVLATVCLAAALLARPAIFWVFGVDFAPAAAPTLWLLPGALFVGMHAVVAQYLAAEGQPKRIIASWSLAVAVMAAAGLFLIPDRGAVGAAISLSIGYLVLLVANLTLAFSIAHRKRHSQEHHLGGQPRD